MATKPRCSVFNGTVLPNKPEFDATKYPNWLILYGTDSTTNTRKYIWLACSKPFLKYAEGVYVYPADSEIIGFGANKSTCTWNSGTITKDEGLADYYTISGTYVWSFMPIYLYSDQTVIAHQAGDMITDWDAEKPTITALAGAGTAESPTGYWKGDTATALVCNATVSDGGTLSYKWYRNGTYVASGSSYTPSTATAGQFAYYCIVTNTLTGDSGFSDVDTVQSDSMVIVVTAKEESDTPVVPDAKAAKHKHIIGYVLKQCGVPMAELIAEMLGKVTKAKDCFNLADFSGQYAESSVSDVGFSVGEFPLAFETSGYFANNHTLCSRLVFKVNNLPFRVGETIRLEVLAPKVDVKDTITPAWHLFHIGSSKGSTLMISVNYKANDISWLESSAFESSSVHDVRDSENNIIGFIFEGTVVDTFDHIGAMFSLERAENQPYESVTYTTTFSNYDDIKITRLKGVK